MTVQQREFVVFAALTAAGKDPDVGRIRIKRGFHATVEDTPTGRRLVAQRGDQHVVLTRYSATQKPPASYPNDLPFVPMLTAWLTATDHVAATWVDITSPDELAATLTARFVAEGWSAESALFMKRWKITVFRHDTMRRTLYWGSRQLLLYDSPA